MDAIESGEALGQLATNSQVVREGWARMKASITFDFSGDPGDYCVQVSKKGELDTGDLRVIAALLQEDIELRMWIALGEIKPTSLDPSGIGQLHSHWSN